MKYRLLRLLLFVSAFGWAISAIGIILPWSTVIVGLNGLGAGTIPHDPMLDYWIRMTAGAFTGIGIFFLVIAINPRRFSNVIGLAGLLQFTEGIVLLIHGLRLGLPPFPFYGDTSFCLLAGACIWFLRNEAKETTDNKDTVEAR